MGKIHYNPKIVLYPYVSIHPFNKHILNSYCGLHIVLIIAEAKLVNSQSPHPLSTTVCNFPPDAWRWRRGSEPVRTKGQSQKWCVCLLLPVPVCVTWANGFLSLRLTLCKRRSLYLQKGFRIFKGKTLNHYSHIWTAFRLCLSHLLGPPKFLREFVWRGVREQVVFLYSPYPPQSLMKHTCLLITGAPD